MQVEKADDSRGNPLESPLPDFQPNEDVETETIKKDIPKKQLTQDQINFLERRRRLRQAAQTKEEENYVPIDLFNSEPPLGIFSKATNEPSESVPTIELETWKKCREREIKILSTPAPKNFLEEMAVKTDQGIFWKFPINNEQGINEKQVNTVFKISNKTTFPLLCNIIS